MAVTAGDGAASARTAGVVELTLEDVRAIARSLAAPHDAAQTQRREFLAAPLEAGMFGRSPGGEALYGAHRTAHEVFTETVRKIVAELEDFQERLEATVTTYETRDGDVQDALLAVRLPERDGRAVIDARSAAEVRPDPTPPPQAPADAAPPPSPGPSGFA